MSNEQTEKNKALVARFFREFFSGPEVNLAALEELVHEDYIQHNPLAGQGREGLRNFLVKVMPQMYASPIAKSPVVKVNLIADGDLVVRQEIRTDWMLIDIFRVENGRVKEHWDALRVGPGIERLPGF